MRLFYRFSWVIVRGLFKVLFGYRVIAAEKVPLKGPLILASNHRSYFDPPLIGVSVGREVHFLAKSELFYFKPFGKLISILNAHPIRRGQKDTAAVDQMIELLKNDKAVVIFPEGTRQRGKKRLGRAKSGIARLAQATGAPIQTVYVRGSNEMIKSMLRFRPLQVYFGRIIDSDEYRNFETSPKGFRALASFVLEEIDRLMTDVETG
jgi:1-acyl-sn-glycerol-3-phosphate acyltransferase